MCVCAHVWLRVHVYVCVRVCMCMCICVCVCAHVLWCLPRGMIILGRLLRGFQRFSLQKWGPWLAPLWVTLSSPLPLRAYAGSELLVYLDVGLIQEVFGLVPGEDCERAVPGLNETSFVDDGAQPLVAPADSIARNSAAAMAIIDSEFPRFGERPGTPQI